MVSGDSGVEEVYRQTSVTSHEADQNKFRGVGQSNLNFVVSTSSGSSVSHH